MFLIIGLVLLGVWIIGFAVFRAVVGGFIHVVLVLAVIALAWHFLSSGRQPSASGSSASLGAGGGQWVAGPVGGIDPDTRLA